MLLDVVKVDARDGHLFLEFENGERRVFDMSDLFAERPFDRLKDSPLFAAAQVGIGTVVWPGNIDIAPEALYLDSKPLAPGQPVSAETRAGKRAREMSRK